MIGQWFKPGGLPPERTGWLRAPPPASLSGVSFRASAMDATPASLSVATPERSASAKRHIFSPGRGAGLGGPNEPPLSEIAPLNSPLASGDAHNMLTAIPPADSPKMVTL